QRGQPPSVHGSSAGRPSPNFASVQKKCPAANLRCRPITEDRLAGQGYLYQTVAWCQQKKTRKTGKKVTRSPGHPGDTALSLPPRPVDTLPVRAPPPGAAGLIPGGPQDDLPLPALFRAQAREELLVLLAQLLLLLLGLVDLRLEFFDLGFLGV